MKLKRLFCLVLLVAFACKQKSTQQSNYHQLNTVKAQGYVIPNNIRKNPKTIPAGKPTIVKASKQKAIPTNTNIQPAGIPKISLAGKPLVCTPGQDSFLLPKKTLAIDSPFFAGIPETVIAKDMDSRDQNPKNFSFFGKIQGLKHNVIRCMLQDKSGYLWLGTVGGGVIRYDGKFFTTFTDAEGLANNNVFSILEDKTGNLWFGTSGGASKYDGKFFTTYTNKQGIANNTVNSILEDKSGNLWFGTEEGASRYDGKYFTTFTKKEGLASNTVNNILKDKKGNLWFGTNEGLSRYNGKSFSNFTTKQGLSNNIITAIREDKRGNIWIATENSGVSKYDGNTFTNYTEKEGLISNIVRCIFEDKGGNFWFGSKGGISKFDGKFFTNYSQKDGLTINAVLSILQDKSENLWFGTRSGGINRFDGKIFTNYTEEEGLTDQRVRSIYKDKYDNLWFGTENGVSKYDGKYFNNLTDKNSIGKSVLGSILEDKSGNIWFATLGNGVIKYDGKSYFNFNQNNGLISNVVWSILEDKSGNIWFGTDGGISKYDGTSYTNYTFKQGLVNNRVRSIYEDKSGNIWIGTLLGVSKYDGKTFTNFNEDSGLANNTVRSILQDKSGNLWFGTEGGASRYNGNYFINFTEKNGLSNNAVFSMLEDKIGNLWFGTRFGLNKLTPTKLTEIINKIKTKTLTEQDIIFKNYSYSEGFLGIGVFAGKTMHQAKDGTIWIGTNDRLTAYHPEGDVTDTVIPNIQLTSIEIFNETINWFNLLHPVAPGSLIKEPSMRTKDTTVILGNGVSFTGFNFDGITKWYSLPENLSLAYNNNYLTFNFIGITMGQSKKVKYQYKLEGLDENWSALTNKTSATYGNLTHGTYTFKVKAMNSEGYWSKPYQYSFIIHPPFWQLWWFRNLIIVVILVLGYSLYRWRTATLRRDKEVLEQIVEERTAEVQNQKQLIEQKHKEITDSINYAERIQRSLLASKKILDENLKDYFIVFKPKDIVSGDFYWAAKLSNNNFAIVTADSTGHGVPGAIMSILNISCLEKSVEVEKLTTPDEILNHTRTKIIETLKNDGSLEGGKDGMDGSLLSFDFKTNILQCAAANSSTWIVRTSSSSEVNNKPELIEIKADRFPIGKHDRDDTSFTLHTLNIQKGDVIYTLTDGFPDQFGGLKGKKFKHKHLKELLLEIAHEPMQTQQQKLNAAFESWKSNLEQVDDVTLIGIKI
jgi:ligand-binding sensor domain-containing protein/serine phosphatase RsbU (regulator of sigma subunit)